jgi:hypothetical protein
MERQWTDAQAAVLRMIVELNTKLRIEKVARQLEVLRLNHKINNGGSKRLGQQNERPSTPE